MPSVPSFSDRSFSKPSTLFTRIDSSSSLISYMVTTGPREAATTFTPMPKWEKTSSMARAVPSLLGLMLVVAADRDHVEQVDGR
ncbi:MAG: hypothetical protein QM757_35170 [Paludibaculum sp.]